MPGIINYQGFVNTGGTPYDGMGHFKFVMVDRGVGSSEQALATGSVDNGMIDDIFVDDSGSGYVTAPVVTITDATGSGATATATLNGDSIAMITVDNPGSGYSQNPVITIDPPPSNLEFVTYWSHDDTSVDGTEPGTSVMWPVSNGLFAVGLGDTDVPNMIEEISPDVFNQDEVFLRVWFSTTEANFQELTPKQRITSVGYAMVADTALLVPDMSITAANLAPGAVNQIDSPDGAITGIISADDSGDVRLFGDILIEGDPLEVIPKDFATDLFSPISVAVQDDFAYVVDAGTDRLQVFGVSDPDAISVAGSLTGLNDPVSIAVQGDFAYVVTVNPASLQIFDVSNPGAIVAKDFDSTGLSIPKSVAVQGNFAYVVDAGTDRLQVFDVSNLDDIFVAAFDQTAGNVSDETKKPQATREGSSIRRGRAMS